jgi:hypothetical protein
MIDQNLSPLSDLLLERAASVRGEPRPFAEPPMVNAAPPTAQTTRSTIHTLPARAAC